MVVLFMILIYLVYLCLAPFIVIWSLNTIFGLFILYSFKNWIAIFLLLFIMKLNLSNK